MSVRTQAQLEVVQWLREMSRTAEMAEDFETRTFCPSVLRNAASILERVICAEERREVSDTQRCPARTDDWEEEEVTAVESPRALRVPYVGPLPRSGEWRLELPAQMKRSG